MNDTEAFFAHKVEQGTLWDNATTHLPEPAAKALYEPMAKYDGWPEQAAEVAALHADREPACECGACRFDRKRRIE